MKTSNIMIVDDTKEVLSAFKRELKDESYSVFFADNGDEALSLISEKPFKVVISDVKMRKMDGFELLDRINKLNPDILRVVLSGHSDVKLILKIVNERGIDRYLTKPWHIDDIKTTIKQCVELYDLRDEVLSLRNLVKPQ